MHPVEDLSRVVLVVAGDVSERSRIDQIATERGRPVHTVATREAALEACRAHRYTVAMIDWSSVGEDPAAVCRELRSIGDPAPLFILALIQEEHRPHLDDILSTGADDFIERPFDAATFTARLDVAERRAASEAALRVGEQKFRSIVNSIPGVVYRCEMSRVWSMQFISDTISTLSGYPASDFLTPGMRTYADIMHADDNDSATAEVERALAERRPFSLEYRITRRDGATRWVNSRGRGVYDSHGNLMFLDGAIFDITESKVAAERLAEQSRKLAEINSELHETHEAKNRMFQNVTHELRTPLTLILSPLETILDEASALPAKEKRRLESMRNNGLRLLNLINDMLDLAKLDAAALVPAIVPTDVHTLVRSIVEDVRGSAVAASVALELAAPEVISNYMLDGQHVERIVLNLLSNALKFTPKGGRILVSIGEDEQGLVLSVRDNGIGIAREAHERIFRRFEQADDRTTRKYGGTGIGLALVRDLARLMGGSVGLESELGCGTCFSIHFPNSLKTAEAATPKAVGDLSSLAHLTRRSAYATLARQAHLPLRRDEGRAGPTILIAEDDPEISQELVELLSPQYRVIAVPNGKEALAVAIESPPHVILSDVMMPEMDGLALAAAVRERPSLRDTAIVLLSARSELDDRVRGREVGVDSYLTKPFHPREVLATIVGVLRARMRVVGSYIIHERLGGGGQGSVYLAEHVSTGQFAALKIMEGTGLDDAESRVRLRREQEAIAAIEHPNIVRIVEQGEIESRHYFAMEYLRGVTVAELLKTSGPMSPGVVSTIGLAVSDALAAIHRKGIVHRDVKPSNIVVTQGTGSLRDRVRLIDFGAVIDQSALTANRAVVGTLPYMAPDALAGREASASGDVYALGVTLYFMCVGSLPFCGKTGWELHEAILAGPTPRVRASVSTIPPALDEIIARAMAAGADRLAVEEMRDALAALDLEDELSVPSGENQPDDLVDTK